METIYDQQELACMSNARDPDGSLAYDLPRPPKPVVHDDQNLEVEEN